MYAIRSYYEFIKYKRQEWTEYHQTISAWETERYSHLF